MFPARRSLMKISRQEKACPVLKCRTDLLSVFLRKMSQARGRSSLIPRGGFWLAKPAKVKSSPCPTRTVTECPTRKLSEKFWQADSKNPTAWHLNVILKKGN